MDKQDFYQGIVLVPIIKHKFFSAIKPNDDGYLVNNEYQIFTKYRTKNNSPWRFSFNTEELNKINDNKYNELKIVFAFVCDGDGICALKYDELIKLLGNSPGWISIKRKYNEKYSVSGQNGVLTKKIELNRLTKILFYNDGVINFKRLEK